MKDTYIINNILFLLVVIALLFSQGCATVPANSPSKATPSNEIYKLNLSGTINGYSFIGYGVVPTSATKTYEIKITSQTDIDAYILRSCAREEVFEQALQIGKVAKWLERKKTLTVSYTPTSLEDRGLCLVSIGAFNQNDFEANGSAMLDIEDLSATLPALSVCNGSEIAGARGATFCETRTGLMQRVSFPMPVVTGTNIQLDCKVDFSVSEDKRVYDFKTPRNLCVYRFSELSTPFRQHRHVSRGYTRVKIRGGGPEGI